MVTAAGGDEVLAHNWLHLAREARRRQDIRQPFSCAFKYHVEFRSVKQPHFGDAVGEKRRGNNGEIVSICHYV